MSNSLEKHHILNLHQEAAETSSECLVQFKVLAKSLSLLTCLSCAHHSACSASLFCPRVTPLRSIGEKLPALLAFICHRQNLE